MGKYRVRFYRSETTSVRSDITVTAASPAEARQRVLDGMMGSVDLTDEELDSEGSGKEEITSSQFDALEDESDPYAVVEE